MKLLKNFSQKPWFNTAMAICIGVLFYVIITHLYLFIAAFAQIYQWIRPVFLGLIIAYILNPLVKWFEKTLFKGIKNQGRRRGLATAVGILAVLLIIAFLLVLLIPQLADSVRTFVMNFGGYTTSLIAMLSDLQRDLANYHIDLSGQIGRIDEILGSISSVITNNMSGIVGVTSSIGSGVVDGILAFIVAIYFLADKHRLKEVLKHFLHHVLSEHHYTVLASYWKRSNDIFVRFIAYDLLDGLIVGVINAIFMLIMGIPYSVLISVIVGVTNLAPTFGPVVGAILGGLILLLVNPWYALWFVIFTIVLQVLDGYVLKPKLFGGSLGVPAIWILITLIVGGRMFGVPGILLAIPFAAIILFLCQELLPDIFGRSEDSFPKS
ncbi:MAG: AI-2E family transporter [Lachnospiraceae bacterium]|nr:AI-2E family transporter [Lachnospiraceae bacterium]